MSSYGNPLEGATQSVILMRRRLEKLEDFFKEVANLTSNHDGIHFHNTGAKDVDVDIAVVYPNRLGAALEKVDPEWWKHAQVLPGDNPRHN